MEEREQGGTPELHHAWKKNPVFFKVENKMVLALNPQLRSKPRMFRGVNQCLAFPPLQPVVTRTRRVDGTAAARVFTCRQVGMQKKRS